MFIMSARQCLWGGFHSLEDEEVFQADNVCDSNKKEKLSPSLKVNLNIS